MEVSICSPASAVRLPDINQAYQTTYQREFTSKRSSSFDEDAPYSRRFLIGYPFQLDEPIGESLYALDFSNKPNFQREPFIRPNTHRANRPHPHKQFPYWPRKVESARDSPAEEIHQALRNQLNSTYRVDYTGAPQAFDLTSAYNRMRPFWRGRAQHTLDSEYRNAFQTHPTAALHTGGRYAFSCRIPAGAIVPQASVLSNRKFLRTEYGEEISQKAPKELYMKDFVDSFNGPIG